MTTETPNVIPSTPEFIPFDLVLSFAEVRALQGVLQELSPFVGKRSTLPILKCVMLVAVDSTTMEVHATNLEAYVIRTLKVTSLKEGTALCTPFSQLVALLKGGKKTDSVTMHADRSDAITFSRDGIQSTCSGFDEGEYPLMPKWEKSGTFEQSLVVEAAALQNVARRNRHALAPEAFGRPTFTGMHVKSQGDTNTVDFVTQDTYRLVVTNVAGNTDHPVNWLIPGSPLCDLFLMARGEVTITQYEIPAQGRQTVPTQVFLLTWEGVTATILGIPATFPNYRNILDTVDTGIADRGGLSATLNRVALLKAVKGVETGYKAQEQRNARKEDTAVTVILTFSESQTVTVEARSEDKPVSVATLSVNRVSGVHQPTRVNARFLIQALEAMSGESVRIDIAVNDPPQHQWETVQSFAVSPMRLIDPAALETTYLILPLRQR